MTLTDLAKKLNELGYPVAYSHFKSEQTLPFICYLVTEVDTFSADNRVISESTYVDIELYVDKKNPEAEQKIKTMLNNNELPYSYYEIFIKDEEVFKCTFSTKLINSN